MSENREISASRAADAPETSANVGAPVAEAETSHTEVLEAVERATATAPDARDDAAANAAASETVPAAEGSVNPTAPAVDEMQRREALSQLDTELDIDVSSAAPANVTTGRIGEVEEMPSAAADPEPVAALPSLADTPPRDGEIRISADHPMAALYTQTPTPPEIRGNRGAGVAITLVATIAFAVVYAGVLALWIAPQFPPSTFVQEGLLPQLMTVGFGAAVAGFFVAMTIVVLVVGRAGWWAYVLGGFLVAAVVWVAAALGSALHDRLVLGERVDWSLTSMTENYGFTITAIVAALVAREATIWFGAWIGSRGRRIKARNAFELAEYEQAMNDVQAKTEVQANAA